MHNDQSGARRHRGRAKEEGEVLSLSEQAARHRGQDLRRVMRAAAALRGIYDDSAIADAVGVHRNTVSGWWKGATPEPETLRRFATATGLSVEELRAFVYDETDPPHLDWTTAAVLEGARRDQVRRDSEDPDTPARPPGQRHRDSGTERR